MKYESVDNEMRESYLAERLERRRRFRIAATVAPGIIAISLLIYRLISPDSYLFPGIPTYSYIYSMLTIGFLGISAIGLLMIYLQTGFKKTSGERSYMYEMQNELTSILSDVRHKNIQDVEKIQVLERQIVDLTTKLEGLSIAPQNVTKEEKEDLISSIKTRLEAEASTDIYNDLIKKVTASVKLDEQQQVVSGNFKDTLSRLREEVSALTRRGNLNLAIGIITTITGLGILGYFVVTSSHQGTELLSFAVGFVPRLSLVILIEVFAYFFLRLYKASLSEIKYFQNEMTNVEAKYASLVVALRTSNAESCSEVIKNLCATERNHILEKGQTTVELEKAKVDKAEITTLVKSFSDLIKKQK